ncbi:MAG: hypothetical protein Q9159_003561 [Coniocarpon cinnabarinum]
MKTVPVVKDMVEDFIETDDIGSEPNVSTASHWKHRRSSSAESSSSASSIKTAPEEQGAPVESKTIAAILARVEQLEQNERAYQQELASAKQRIHDLERLLTFDKGFSSPKQSQGSDEGVLVSVDALAAKGDEAAVDPQNGFDNAVTLNPQDDINTELNDAGVSQEEFDQLAQKYDDLHADMHADMPLLRRHHDEIYRRFKGLQRQISQHTSKQVNNILPRLDNLDHRVFRNRQPIAWGGSVRRIAPKFGGNGKFPPDDFKAQLERDAREQAYLANREAKRSGN